MNYDHKHVMRVGAVFFVGSVGLTATIISGLAYLQTQTEPPSIVALATGATAGLIGWLTQANGKDLSTVNGSGPRDASFQAQPDLQPGQQRLDGNILPGGAHGGTGGAT